MPRSNGVYSAPAGTKGTPNTTIQSAPYNSFIDDLVADANAPRPLTAGGTGATNATSARANLGIAIGTNVQAYDAGLTSIAGLTTAVDRMIYTTAADVYATAALTPFARTLLDDLNAAAARATLGADDAANLTTGILANARLSGTYDGLTELGSTRLRLLATNDASETSTAHALQIGPTTGQNLRIDTNEILTVENGAAGGALFIQNGIGFGAGVTLSVTDGGTGAATAAAARTSLGADDASNLTAGTLANARLSGGYSFSTLDLINVGVGLSLRRADVLNARLYADGSNNLILRRYNLTTGAGEGYIRITGNGVDDFDYNGNTIWHRGNDGAGSGLDADLLDGQEGAFYRSASNLNAGTLNNARLSGDYSFANLTLSGQLKVGADGIQFSNNDTITYDDGDNSYSFISDGTVAGTIIRAGRYLDAAGNDVVYDTRTITAGNGMTGGGSLAANRAFALGAPSTLSATSTNSVGTATHAHNVDTASIVVDGTKGLAVGAIGSYAFMSKISGGQLVPGQTTSGSTLEYTSGNVRSGTSPPGTWRCMGYIDTGNSPFGSTTSLFLRIS